MAKREPTHPERRPRHARGAQRPTANRAAGGPSSTSSGRGSGPVACRSSDSNPASKRAALPRVRASTRPPRLTPHCPPGRDPCVWTDRASEAHDALESVPKEMSDVAPNGVGRLPQSVQAAMGALLRPVPRTADLARRGALADSDSTAATTGRPLAPHALPLNTPRRAPHPHRSVGRAGHYGLAPAGGGG
jgi:hypothetical protein